MAAAVHHRAGSPEEVDASKRRKIQGSVGFDLSRLLRDINGQLERNINSRQAADDLIRDKPDILTPLSLLDKPNLEALVREQLEIDGYAQFRRIGIENVIKILYSTSLINSSYGRIARDLEGNIAEYIQGTTRVTLGRLIKEARGLTQTRTSPEVLARLNMTITKIIEFSNLFFFHHFENKQKMWNLLRHSDAFPRSLENFHRLTQQLAASQRELRLLSELRTLLQAKVTKIHRQIGAAQGARRETLSKEREAFLEHRAQLLWDSGIELVETSFQTLFGRGRADIPEDFVKAVHQTVQNIPEYKALTIEALVQRPLAQLPPRYVSVVWDHFLGEIRGIVDIGDLMRRLIGNLPEEDFARLDSELKGKDSNPKEVVLRALNQYLAAEIRVPITPTSLKEWIRLGN